MGCRRQSPQAPQSICQHRLLSAKQFLHMHRSGRGLCSERHNTGMKLAQVRSLLWCNFCVSPTVAALSACIPQLSSSWVQARIRICLPSGWRVTKVLSYQLILHSFLSPSQGAWHGAAELCWGKRKQLALCCHGADITALCQAVFSHAFK